MKLFIIGNGFDIEHGMNTQYSDFRRYIMEKYNIVDQYDFVMPEVDMTPDGDCIPVEKVQ